MGVLYFLNITSMEILQNNTKLGFYFVGEKKFYSTDLAGIYTTGHLWHKL